ncbi:hypothetical protein ACWG0P_05255 [Amedibacillus sp. YH-ame6]
MSKENLEEIITAFHCMWDAFPGPVRLIDKTHIVLAANPIADEKGFKVGVCCARVGDPSSHRGCKSAQLLKTRSAQCDRPEKNRIRGWVPVKGFDSVYVHYTLQLSDEENI